MHQLRQDDLHQMLLWERGDWHPAHVPRLRERRDPGGSGPLRGVRHSQGARRRGGGQALVFRGAAGPVARGRGSPAAAPEGGVANHRRGGADLPRWRPHRELRITTRLRLRPRDSVRRHLGERPSRSQRRGARRARGPRRSARGKTLGNCKYAC